MSTWRSADDREPSTLRPQLDAVARHLGLSSAAAGGAIFDRWADVVGPAAAAHTTPLRLRDGTLTVGCDHAAWVASLTHLDATMRARLDEVAGPGVVTAVRLVVDRQKAQQTSGKVGAPAEAEKAPQKRRRSPPSG